MNPSVEGFSEKPNPGHLSILGRVFKGYSKVADKTPIDANKRGVATTTGHTTVSGRPTGGTQNNVTTLGPTSRPTACFNATSAINSTWCNFTSTTTQRSLISGSPSGPKTPISSPPTPSSPISGSFSSVFLTLSSPGPTSATSSNPTSSNSTNIYVLPTTTLVTNGQTEYFSQTQFSNLANITTPTVITTAFAETDAAGHTTAIAAPVTVGPGGFYWAPVPFPISPAIPLPILPPIPFPGPPPLPTFPCFHLGDIFSTSCSGGNNNPSNNDPNPSSNNPTPSSDNNSPSRTQSQSDSSSTLSRCSMTTISACSTTVICPTLTGKRIKRATCATSSTCSEVGTGCGVTTSSTMSTATATATPYVVYPKDGADNGQVNSTEQFFTQFGVSGGSIRRSTNKYLGLNFWILPLNSTQVTTLQNNPLVNFLGPKCLSDCFDPATFEEGRRYDDAPLGDIFSPEPNGRVEGLHGTIKRRGNNFVKQRGASDDMVFISSDPADPKAFGGNYIYDKSAGERQTVYVIDTGANLANLEFKNIAPRWIFAGIDTDTVQDDSSVYLDPQGNPGGKGHGTCLLSKVGGLVYGVAKKVSPVVVRVMDVKSKEDYLDAVSKTLEDFITQKRAGTITRAVVNMSFYYGLGHVDEGWIDTFRGLLQRMVEEGLFLVTGSGNDASRTISGFPASFADPGLAAGRGVPQLLVVGAVSTDGSIWPGTNWDSWLRYYAPGDGIQCAAAFGSAPYWKGSGTSISSASAAGLAAYFLGLDQISDIVNAGETAADKAQSLKNYMESLAWSRKGDAPAMWNGVKKKDVGPNCILMKRQAEGPTGEESCEQPSSTISPSSVPGSSGFVTLTKSANGTTNVETPTPTPTPAPTPTPPPAPAPAPAPIRPHVHCRVRPNFLYFSFTIDTAQWTDYKYGQTILDYAGRCGWVTGWTWEAGNHWNFGDVVADHYGSFNLPLTAGQGCVEDSIERAMGLEAGSVLCLLPLTAPCNSPLSCMD
ncbi:MAG: hypothetical protein M1813_002384 [Trichoglossum hirsutum]|nr:MAG: hypothetical protein M1813_002384 [Trichoglossum hirsutum]